MAARDDQERVVYPMPKRVAILGIVCCGIIGLVGVAVILLAIEFWPRIGQFSTKVARGTLAAGILITLVGGAGMLWCCWRLLVPRNMLVLDARGLTGLYFGRLLWEEVRRLYVHEQKMGPVRACYLVIEPQDIE